MNRRNFVISTSAWGMGLFSAARIAGQGKAMEPDLAALAAGKGLQAFNRGVSVLKDGATTGAHLDQQPGDGVAYVPGIEFANGSIEMDLRGKNLPQQSFVGVAFHGVDGTTFDAVYFRPFNFRAEAPASRGHSVQYISQPVYTWMKLRTEHPGMYEQALNPPPDPDAWFHARIVVASPKVSVFLGDGMEPVLAVDQLNQRKTGLVGLWVGNNSSGDFANLKIVPA